MTEQDEKTLAAVLERYPYDDELAGIEAGVLRRLRADLARAHAARDRAEEAELVALGYLDNATQGQTDLRASKVIDELRADLARVTARLEAAEQERIRYERAAEKDYAEFKVICAQRDRAEAARVEAREILEVVADDEAYPGGPFIVRRWLGRYAARNAPTTGGE